jgi:hypothetical protein
VTGSVSIGENGFGVELREEPPGWCVVIVDGSGAALAERVCADHLEARSYASTVRQHIYWLSPERFRAYYRL